MLRAMEKENERLDEGTSRTTRIIGYSLAGGLFGFVCAVAPFGLGLSRTRRFSLIPKLEPGIEDPHRLATRALMWGTFYSVSGVGALSVGVCMLLGVKSFPEFGQKMKTILPPKAEKIRKVVPQIKRKGLNDWPESDSKHSTHTSLDK